MSHTAIPNPAAASLAHKRERSLPALAEITKVVTYGATLAGICYSGVTIAAMFVIRQMSPHRPMSWLAGEAEESSTP